MKGRPASWPLSDTVDRDVTFHSGECIPEVGRLVHFGDEAGAGLLVPAYRYIGQVEEGWAKAEGDTDWNQALILEPPHSLQDWMAAPLRGSPGP